MHLGSLGRQPFQQGYPFQLHQHIQLAQGRRPSQQLAIHHQSSKIPTNHQLPKLLEVALQSSRSSPTAVMAQQPIPDGVTAGAVLDGAVLGGTSLHLRGIGIQKRRHPTSIQLYAINSFYVVFQIPAPSGPHFQIIPSRSRYIPHHSTSFP